MIYAQFFHLSTGYVEGSNPPRYEESARKRIEACGSNGVAILDARRSLAALHFNAARICAERGFLGYRLMRGARFTDARPMHDSIIRPADHTA